MISFLQEKTPTVAVETNFDTATHPEKGLLRGYLVRVLCTANAAQAVTPTYEEWRDTILADLITLLQLFAPRYSQQLCSANLTGAFWAKLYEDAYGQCLPIEVANTPVTYNSTRQIPNANTAVQIELFIPFETPKLGVDRLYTAPPCSLFRGDVALKAKWAATSTVQAIAITFSALTIRWLAVHAHGDNARVPVIHRFERRTFSQDSIDIGRGFPAFITDNRAPDQTIQYDVFIDGENVNRSAMYGEDLMADYRIGNKNQVPETSIYTPLCYIPENSSPADLVFVENSLAIKLTGASSGTLDMHFMEPANAKVGNALKASLGIAPQTKTRKPPVTPASSALGNLHKKVAMNGPRTLLIENAGKFVTPNGGAQTVPTVPSGSLGANIAQSLG